MERFPVQRSPAEWALQWLWDQPEVSVVLSGMSTMEQVEENLQLRRRFAHRRFRRGGAGADRARSERSIARAR